MQIAVKETQRRPGCQFENYNAKIELSWPLASQVRPVALVVAVQSSSEPSVTQGSSRVIGASGEWR